MLVIVLISLLQLLQSCCTAMKQLIYLLMNGLVLREPWILKLEFESRSHLQSTFHRATVSTDNFS